MRIAVAGGTGCVGGHVVDAARAAGHEVSVISRSSGTDLVSGRGMPEALTGVEVVIDVSNSAVISRSRSVAFFGTATRNLLAAGATAGVGHHVALSIVGIDRVPFGYYEGKRVQEKLIAQGAVPWTVLRATQFHEFPAQLLEQAKGPLVPVPRMRSAPVAAREVAQHLLEIATGPALGLAPQLAGPEVHEMTDLTRSLIRVRRSRRWVVPVRLPGRTGSEMAGGGLLPTVDGPRGLQTFAEWLREQAT